MKISNLANIGLILVLSSYIVWGLTPLFYHGFTNIEAMEIFSMRIIFSIPIIIFLFLITKTQMLVFKILLNSKTLIPVFLSTACIFTSWYLNTWGATNGQVLMVSLAYFLTPLVSVLIGVVYLRENLNRLQLIALSFCSVGFLYACINLESFPWLTVGIAIAFGCYGVIKKQVKIDTINGLACETILMLPFAIYYFTSSFESTQWRLNEGNIRILLFLTAPITLLPLGLFTLGISRVKNLSTIAILQYIEPTLYFLLAVFIFDEGIDSSRMLTFTFIWIGFFIFSFDGIYRNKKAKIQLTT